MVHYVRWVRAAPGDTIHGGDALLKVYIFFVDIFKQNTGHRYGIRPRGRPNKKWLASIKDLGILSHYCVHFVYALYNNK